jgi:hypothetical protein
LTVAWLRNGALFDAGAEVAATFDGNERFSINETRHSLDLSLQGSPKHLKNSKNKMMHKYIR